MSISARVTLAEIGEELSRLNFPTGGQGSTVMAYHHYDPVPPRRQQELIAAYRARPDRH